MPLPRASAPRSAQALLTEAFGLLRAGDEAAAEALYLEAAEIKPVKQMRAYWPDALLTGAIGEEWATPALRRVDLHINHELPEMARALLARIDEPEVTAQVFAARARLALAARNWPEALAYADEARVHAPSSAYIAIVWGAALLANNRVREALLPLTQAAGAGRAGAWFLLGLAHQRLQQPAEAVEAYRKGFAFDPTDVGPANNLFSALIEARRLEDAVAHADLLLSQKPGHTTSLAFKYVALGQLGRTRDVEAFAPPSLIERHELPVPPAYATRAHFHGALAGEIIRDVTLAYERNTTRLGHQTYDISGADTPALSALNTTISAIVRARIAVAQTRAAHPFDRAAPWDFKLYSWAVVLRKNGYQMPHFHPLGWLSGVYYIEIPATITDADPTCSGWIEFGRAEERWNPATTPMPLTQIRPEEGVLLTFPSYYWHNTRPVASDARRISFSFDVMPL
jgi:tetratricopeptide (TPR) repeat protein